MSTHRNLRPPSEQETLLRLVRSVRARVEEALADGEIAVPRPSSPPVDPTEGRIAQKATLSASPPLERSLFTPPDLSRAQTLEEVREVLGDCRRCKLCTSRTQIVFGVGPPRADLMFVGEGPGRDEDLQGEPFVGRAGQLLTDIITRGMKMSREEVYIANVVKCRPPENRNPESDEIEACLPFLERQIELVQPRIIVALGKVAAQALLGTKSPIMRVRGNWHTYRGIRVMPTLHPAYLLRNPADKRLVWEDIKLVMRELEKNG